MARLFIAKGADVNVNHCIMGTPLNLAALRRFGMKTSTVSVWIRYNSRGLGAIVEIDPHNMLMRHGREQWHQSKT
jgi:hypothetical protein